MNPCFDDLVAGACMRWVGTFRKHYGSPGVRNPDSGLSLATYLRWTKKPISVEPQCPVQLMGLCST